MIPTRYQIYSASAKGKERHRLYAASPRGKARFRKYITSPKGKAAHIRAVLKYRTMPDGKLKEVAVKAVSHAIRAGKISKQLCEICGNIKVEAHHQDYQKPLEVKWLCPKCHRKLHREMKSA